METPKVGAETQAYCTSCKTMGEHVIVAMVGAKPAKVECTECHKQHLYRAAPPGTKVAKTPGTAKPRAKSRKGSDASAKLPTIDLATLLAGRTPRAYDLKVGFGLGEVVLHPTFGLGLVTNLPGAQKMEVTFESGAKLLSHDRGGAALAPALTRPQRREDDGGRRPASDAPPARAR